MQKNGIKGYLVVVNCMSRGQRLTAEVVDNQCQSVLSVEGSNKRAKEEAIAFNLTHYLEDVEERLITTTVPDPDTDEIHTTEVELARVLQFVNDAPPYLPLDLSNS